MKTGERSRTFWAPKEGMYKGEIVSCGNFTPPETSGHPHGQAWVLPFLLWDWFSSVRDFFQDLNSSVLILPLKQPSEIVKFWKETDITYLEDFYEKSLRIGA